MPVFVFCKHTEGFPSHKLAPLPYSGLFSDGHPQNASYLNDLKCDWSIMRRSDPSLPVHVSFSLFVLEVGYDFLYVYDIVDPSWLVAQLTGSGVCVCVRALFSFVMRSRI